VDPSAFGTPASDALCRSVRERSGPAVLLGFSRGKDSVAAWLQLRRFFDVVVPFHCASVPHLSFVDASLSYYEAKLGAPIERFVDSTTLSALHSLTFQPPGAEREIEELEVWEYSKHDLAQLLRDRYAVPDAYCAYGISAADSIDRRVGVADCGGRHDSVRTFYPCFDWPKPMILSWIEHHGLRLADDYRLANRSLAGFPTVRHLEAMERLYPDDLARVEEMFPLCRAAIARNHFRRLRRSARRAVSQP
jgi:hypothetical protein